MTRLSVSFDPANDPIERVQAYVAALYNVQPAASFGQAIGEAHNDRPDVGEGPGETPVSGTFDAEGFPWDERIHASNKAMTAKGVWTKRKNVDNGQREQVEAELRASGKTGQPGGGTAATHGDGTPAGWPSTADRFSAYQRGVDQEYTPEELAFIQKQGQQGAPIIPPPPTQQTAAPAVPGLPSLPASSVPGLPNVPAAPTRNAFAEFNKFILEHIQSPANPGGRINGKYVDDVLTHIAGTTLANLDKQPADKIDACTAFIKQQLGVA